MKKLLILFFISYSLLAQVIVVGSRPPEPTVESKSLGTIEQGSTYSDSLTIVLNTRRITIDSVKSDGGVTADIYDSLLVYGDTLKLLFDVDISTVGSYIGYWYWYHSGYGSPDTSTVSYTVASGYNLIAETSMDFDTVSVASQDYLTISNSSEEPIGSISYSGLASPFTLSSTVSTLDADSEHDILVTFSAIENGTYYDTLIITSTADNSPVSVPMVGVWSADTIPSSSQWLAASPGGGGWFRSLRINPTNEDKMYMTGDLSGFFKSTDGGNTWASSNTGIDNLAMDAIALHPNGTTIFIATNGGIYKSTDGGDSWTRKGENQIYGEIKYQLIGAVTNDSVFSTSAVYIHPANNDLVFAGTGFSHNVDWVGASPAKIFKSSDGGETWAESSTGIETGTNSFSSFAGHSSNASIVYASSRQGLYRSTNGGSNWSRIKTGSIRWVAVNPSNINEIWYTVNYEANGLYKYNVSTTTTTKIGDNFSGLNGDYNQTPIEIKFNSSGTRAYVSIGNQSPPIYYTTDGGSTWSSYPLASGKGWYRLGTVATSFDVVGDNIFYCNDYGVYGSNNGGVSFDPKHTELISGSSTLGQGYWASTGPELNVGYGMISDPITENKIFRLTGDTGLQISLDGGYSWKYIESAKIAYGIDGIDYKSSVHSLDFDANYATNNTVYLLVGLNDDTDVPESIMKSTDGGFTWSEVSSNLPDGRFHHLEIDENNVMYVTTVERFNSSDEGGIWKSTNGGVTFTQIFSGERVRMLEIDPQNSSILYAPTMHGHGLYKSTNGGSTWSMINNTEIKDPIWVEVHPTNSSVIFVAQRGYSFPDSKPGGIWKSTNGGVSFTRVLAPVDSDDPGYYTMVKFDPLDVTTLYATSRGEDPRSDSNIGDGIFISEDGGSTWSSLNKNLTITSLSGVNISPHNGQIYIYSRGGGSYMLDKVTPTAPTISTFLAEGDGINQEIDVTVNYSNSELGLYAYADISTSKATLFDGADDNYVMTTTANQATYTFTSIDTSQKYYLQSIVGNIIGRDTSSIDSVEFNTEVAVVDTFYPAETWDDVYRAYSTGFYGTYSYNNIGYLGTDVKAGVRFRNVNDFSRIDSAKIEFTAYQAGTTTIDMTIWGEDNSSPLVFSTYSDFDARVLTTDSSTALQNYSTNWSTDGTYLIDVTDIVAELMGSYTYSNGSIAFLIHPKAGHTMTGSVARTFYGYEYNSGEKKAKLIIWGTQ